MNKAGAKDGKAFAWSKIRLSHRIVFMKKKLFHYWVRFH